MPISNDWQRMESMEVNIDISIDRREYDPEQTLKTINK